MIKSINVERIKKREEFLNTKLLTKEEVKTAIEKVIKQIDANMNYFKDKFPYSATKNNIYPIIENIEQTDGFWIGLLWLAYEYTGDNKYRELAEKNVLSFKNRVDKDIEIDHHDLGFLYSLSCVSAYKLTGSEVAKEASIKAANKLINWKISRTRWIYSSLGRTWKQRSLQIYNRLFTKYSIIILGDRCN